MGSFKTILAASAAVTLLLSRFAAIPFGFSALPTFLALTALLAISRFVYTVLLWPFVFSPIRNLPGPKPSSWFMGDFMKIYSMPTGEPHREWFKIPNNGLIRYMGLWNAGAYYLTHHEALVFGN
jgi:ABC-type multidrug transport system permease subunit